MERDRAVGRDDLLEEIVRQRALADRGGRSGFRDIDPEPRAGGGNGDRHRSPPAFPPCGRRRIAELVDGDAEQGNGEGRRKRQAGVEAGLHGFFVERATQGVVTRTR